MNDEANIPNQSSIKLAEMVVCYRYIGLYRDMSVLAMEELGKRRVDGENFDYESYIDEQLRTLPVLDVDKPSLGSVVNILGKYLKGNQ